MLSRTRRTALIGIARVASGAALLGIGAAGCGSHDPSSVSARAKAANFGAANEAYTKLGYRHVWTGFPSMTKGARVKTMDSLGEVVAVQDTAGMLSVLEATSGQTRWSDQLGNPLTRFVGVVRDERRVICSSESEAFFLDLDTGTLVGKQHLDKVSNTRPEIVGEFMVYGTSGGEIFAQIKSQGFRAWGNSMPGTIEINPARLGTTLGFVASYGDVLFLDGVSGSGFVRGKMFRGTRVPLAASADLMFVASEDQSIYAFSPTRAAPVWRHRTDVPLNSPPVYHGGIVYCAIDGAGLTAFTEYGDSGRGKVVWASKSVMGVVLGMAGGRLLVWDGKNLNLLDPATGDLVERAPLGNVALVTTDKFVDGNLYLATPEGVVAKLSPRK